MSLPVSFIGRRREGRRYHGEETVDVEWSYSMLLFQGRRDEGATLVLEGGRSMQGSSWFLCGSDTVVGIK
jgi:hypothetical protein